VEQLRYTGGRAVSEQEGKLDLLLKSLNHPLRRRILRALAEKPGSASVLARAFKMELSVISYHLNRVLWEGCDAVELVEMIPRRGSVEKVYRLNPKVWGDLPGATTLEAERSELRRLTLGECFLEALEVLDGDALAQLEGSAWEWFPVTVDSKAWKAICEARQEFNERVGAAVKESQERGEGRRGKTHEVIVGAAAFPAAPRPADR
jgi:DNA-binding transcriptional ArsR family regulator